MEFIAIDVETANADPASICQIGLVAFRGADVLRRWVRHVNPGCAFHATNVRIHGIDESVVAGAPSLDAILPPLFQLVDSRLVVSHSVFDRTALNAAAGKRKLSSPACRWLDVSRVAREVWPAVEGGYGLANLCAKIGHDFDHHDALADAEACGRLFLKAQEISGRGAVEWYEWLSMPPSKRKPGTGEKTRAMAGAVDGPLAGQAVVFTGKLTLSREEASQLAAAAGCRVMTQVSRATTLVVVGEQDLALLNGHAKSTKHRRAEELIADGCQIDILSESAFRQVVATGELP